MQLSLLLVNGGTLAVNNYKFMLYIGHYQVVLLLVIK